MSALPTYQFDTDHTAREIESELIDFLERRRRDAQSYSPHYETLWDIAAECILGGKLMRPRLLINVFDALSDGAPHQGSPAPRSTALRVAACMELLHYSFLLHDDVIDGDLTRRHHRNLIGRLLENDRRERHRFSPADPHHWAATGGILMGDLMLTAALNSVARQPLPHDSRIRLLDLLDRTVDESVAGQLVDVGLSDGIIAPEMGEVLRMSRLKTGTYTFELPLRAAAILADSPPHVEAALGEMGTHLGLAFQLQDDLLSAFASPEDHGKDAFSDLREGKQTALIAYARETSAWPRIEPLLGAPDFEVSDGAAVRDLLSSCGAEGFVRSLVAQQIHACMELLRDSETSVPPAVRRIIADLMTSLEDRRG